MPSIKPPINSTVIFIFVLCFRRSGAETFDNREPLLVTKRASKLIYEALHM